MPTSPSFKIFSWLLLLSLLTSCASTAPSRRYSPAGSVETSAAGTSELSTGRAESAAKGTNASANKSAADRPTQEPAAPRRMVYEAYVRLLVPQLDSAQAQVRRLVIREQGYLVQTSEENMRLRVPSARLQAVLAALPAVGKVESQRLAGQDVTDEYTDYQIRLDNAQKARLRYLELLARATNVSEAIAVEKELQRLNTEIDQLTGRLQRLEHVTDYATLNVGLRTKTRLGPLGYVSVGLYKAVRWLFVGSK